MKKSCSLLFVSIMLVWAVDAYSQTEEVLELKLYAKVHQ